MRKNQEFIISVRPYKMRKPVEGTLQRYCIEGTAINMKSSAQSLGSRGHIGTRATNRIPCLTLATSNLEGADGLQKLPPLATELLTTGSEPGEPEGDSAGLDAEPQSK